MPPVWAMQNGPVIAGTVADAGQTAAKYLKLARSVGPGRNKPQNIKGWHLT